MPPVSRFQKKVVKAPNLTYVSGNACVLRSGGRCHSQRFLHIEYTNKLQEELNMKFNQWTLALASAGMVSLSSIALADSHSVLDQVSKTTISGYVDTSAIWSIGEGGNANFPGRINDGAGYVDGFNLNVVQLSLESPLDDSEWAAGYGVDLWMGPDASWLASNFTGTGDLGIKQAYVALRAPVGNGLDIKMGQFDAIIGYEVGSSPLNPNFSRSYGYFLEPFQHTGVLASYQLTDQISVSGGVANTYGFGINDRPNAVGQAAGEGRKTYMASVSYEIPEEAGFLAGGAIYAGVTDGLVQGGDVHDKTSYYVGATVPTPIDGLALGLAFDLADTSATNPATNLASGDAWALAGYLSYQVTEKMTFNGRIDYAEADNGVFFNTNDGGDSELLSLTGTIDYSLWDNVISRLEVRWDQSLDGGDAFGGSRAGGFFGPADSEDAVTIAINAIYSF